MTIVHIPDSIKQEFKINLDGSTTASLRAAARIIGVSHQVLSKVFECTSGNLKQSKSAEKDAQHYSKGGNLESASDNLKPLKSAEKDVQHCSKSDNLELSSDNLKLSKLAKKLIKHGFSLDNLKDFANSGISDIALGLILEYYAYEAEPRNQKEQSKAVCRMFSTTALRTWIKSELGVGTASAKERKSIDSLTTDDLEYLELHHEFGYASQPETLLIGIDPVFWDMPKKVVEHLLALRKYDRLQRSVESRVLLYRQVRFGTSYDVSEEEARSMVIAGKDLDITHILKKHAQCDRAAALNDIGEYRSLATDPALIRAAATYQKKIDKKLAASGSISKLIAGK